MKGIQTGMLVEIEVGEFLKRGKVTKILPMKKGERSVRVKIHTGEEGTVYRVITKEEIMREKFKFYNLFFYSKHTLTIMNKKTREILIDNIQYPRTQKVEQTAYLFSDEKSALTYLMKRGDDSLAIKRVSRKKPLVENFKGMDIDSFYLDDVRKVTPQKLNEYEEHFKMMG